MEKNKFIEAICNITKKLFNNQGGINGMIIHIADTNEVFQLCVGNREKKIHFVNNFFKQYCQTKSVTRFAVISEAWVSIDAHPNIIPEYDPNRKEMVICFIIDICGDKIFSAEIIKENGKRFIEGLKEQKEAKEICSPLWDCCVQYTNMN